MVRVASKASSPGGWKASVSLSVGGIFEQKVCLDGSKNLTNADIQKSNSLEYQLQYPPNSQPTDITLSQFLSIQEKGVSAWCFEPDYETVSSLLVHARTEITFLPDPASSSCVQSNLPLP